MTDFNAIFAALFVLLILTGSWKSLTFLPVVVANMVMKEADCSIAI